jgi:NAD-dependent dihydropyrimidine dehydrogenase PreA subunit
MAHNVALKFCAETDVKRIYNFCQVHCFEQTHEITYQQQKSILTFHFEVWIVEKAWEVPVIPQQNHKILPTG